MPTRLPFLALLLTTTLPALADPPSPPIPPKAVDDRLTVELVSQEPDVLTPTAIGVDAQGRVWLLENNTHFRPKDYKGPPTDRVLILDDFGPDGRARRISVFADGFRDGMGLRLLPEGGVIVSTRAETFRLRDTHGTGRADERVSLLKLDTKDDYPHNGLNGVVLDGAGHLFVGLGENHAMPWTLTGSDGTVIRGSDEGGIFRCDLTGNKLERWALGVWNPFGLTMDDQGRLFALDNDPGAGSFCRLLDVVRHGDYGYRCRYGRTIDHPFLSWFGQIPGTLPPVCLVGEAPTGIIQTSASGLPSELCHQLLGCTWNDHGIQRFPLEKRGASFTSNPEWLVRGGNDFRPSGIAQAPDGSLLIADWVDSSYEVHGKGRVWRVKMKEPSKAAAAPPEIPRNADETLLGALLAHDGDQSSRPFQINPKMDFSTDPFLFHGDIEAIVAQPDLESKLSQLPVESANPRTRLGVLLIYRRSHLPQGIAMLPKWLADPDGSIRRAALQWISEEHLMELQPKLETVLTPPLSRETFEAYLAAIQMMVSGQPDSKATISQTRQIALDTSRPADLRALALRLLPTAESALSGNQLHTLLQDPDPSVRTQAVRILATRSDASSQAELRRLAADASVPSEFRADAITGLTASVTAPETGAVLQAAAAGDDPIVRDEALRALRGHCTAEEFEAAAKHAAGTDPAAREVAAQLLIETRGSPAVQSLAIDPRLAAAAAPHPAPTEPWPAVLTGPGDPAAGRRIFYHPNGPRCYTCHTIEGRGGIVGPDLTQIGKFSAADLLVAIREPSKDIAPAFTQWLLKLKDGREVNGIDAFEDDKTGVHLIDATGHKTRYPVSDIVSREPLPISLMPPGLDNLMTEQEMRDLLAFLREARD